MNQQQQQLQYRPTHKKRIFCLPWMQAKFLNSPFLIASQKYCTYYFLFPPFLVQHSNFLLLLYGSHCFLLLHSVVVAILKTNFRCQYYRTCVTTSVSHLFRSTRYGTVESVSCTGTYRPYRQEAISCSHVKPHILLFLITGSTILIDFLLLRLLSFFFF